MAGSASSHGVGVRGDRLYPTGAVLRGLNSWVVAAWLWSQDFVWSEAALRQRLLKAAVINLVLAPFLLMFLVIYFFMKHAERFYHSPGAGGGLLLQRICVCVCVDDNSPGGLCSAVRTSIPCQV